MSTAISPELNKSVERKSLYLLPPAIIAGYFLGAIPAAAGVLAGGIIGIFNFRWLLGTIDGILSGSSTQANGTNALLHFLRLGLVIALFSGLVYLHYLKLVNIFAALAGFTVTLVIFTVEAAIMVLRGNTAKKGR
ncbi:MAG: ATP synthase subunit I [Nitrospirota bacterium]|nr:ATP synthase subunit I [Nitrospirota bacterium]